MCATNSNPAPGDSLARIAREEAAAFDRIVAHQGDFNPFRDRGWETLARRFRQMVQPRTAPPGQFNLLDVGCGTGQSRRIYDGSCRRYTGLDLSEASLRLARSANRRVNWLRGDACVLPFADACFDVVAFSSVLHHIPEYVLALKEARRVLRPGGCAFAYDPNLLNPPMALFRNPRSPLYTAEGVSPHERPLLPAALRSAFESADLHGVRQRCQSDIPYRHVAPRLMNTCLTVYNCADWLLEHSMLGRLFGTFVLTVGYNPGTV